MTDPSPDPAPGAGPSHRPRWVVVPGILVLLLLLLVVVLHVTGTSPTSHLGQAEHAGRPGQVELPR